MKTLLLALLLYSQSARADSFLGASLISHTNIGDIPDTLPCSPIQDNPATVVTNLTKKQDDDVPGTKTTTLHPSPGVTIVRKEIPHNEKQDGKIKIKSTTNNYVLTDTMQKCSDAIGNP